MPLKRPSQAVASGNGLGNLWTLVIRWKGSVYKLIWADLLLYTLVYFLLSALYRFCLDEERRRLFELISLQMEYFTELIPLAFVLGFYVTIVVQRWWGQFENIPWPDSLCTFVSAFILGNDDEGRMIRRQVMRYVNLSSTMALSLISPLVKKRYPTTSHLVEAGFLTRYEKKIIDTISNKTPHSMFALPITWAASLVVKARQEGRIRDDMAVKTIIDEINRYRTLCGKFINYDWISIPLVYSQVVTIAVWSFFIATLMGRQFLDTKMSYPHHSLDYVVPLFTYFQFLFYVGWLKVAQTLAHPFANESDGFETNFVIERNFQICYIMVDEMHDTTPHLVKDFHWDEVSSNKIPSSFGQKEHQANSKKAKDGNLDRVFFSSETKKNLDSKV